MKDGVFTTDMCPHTCARAHMHTHVRTHTQSTTQAHLQQHLAHEPLCLSPSTPAFLPLCEDGHYKCKVVVEDCPRLLLIREGTGIPSHEVWSCGCM